MLLTRTSLSEVLTNPNDRDPAFRIFHNIYSTTREDEKTQVHVQYSSSNMYLRASERPLYIRNMARI